MKKRPKQPVETVRAWVPWTLLGLGLAELGLSIFQWVELRTIQAGGTAVCSINASVNCETVWTSPFAQRLGTLTGEPTDELAARRDAILERLGVVGVPEPPLETPSSPEPLA